MERRLEGLLSSHGSWASCLECYADLEAMHLHTLEAIVKSINQSGPASPAEEDKEVQQYGQSLTSLCSIVVKFGATIWKFSTRLVHNSVHASCISGLRLAASSSRQCPLIRHMRSRSGFLDMLKVDPDRAKQYLGLINE